MLITQNAKYLQLFNLFCLKAGWRKPSSNYTGNVNINTSNAKSVTLTAQWRANCTENCTELDLAVGESMGYSYTGSVVGVTIKKAGTYKLEVWGAQGGGSSYSGYTLIGGYGGYSYGNISFPASSIYYIIVGGKGTDGNTDTGREIGGNGGFGAGGGGGAGHSGNGNYGYGAGGGGGMSGFFKSTTFNGNEIIIAGGGGGSTGINAATLSYMKYFNYDTSCSSDHFYGYNGGSGGGYTAAYSTVGGTQSSGGQRCGSDGFLGATGGGKLYGGHGWTDDKNNGGKKISNGNAETMAGGSGDYIDRDSSSARGGGGGGGGYYGGAGATYYSTSGGGSGYIGNSSLSSKGMYMYSTGCTSSTATATKTTCTSNTGAHVANAANTGNGYAKITRQS